MQPDNRQLNKECKPGCKTKQRWTEKKIEDRGHESLGFSRKDDGGHPRMLRNQSSWAVRVYRRKIILIEGNANWRHLNKLTYKWTLRQVFIRVYRLKIASFLYFQPSFGICVAPLCVAPLPFSVVQLFPPRPLPCVNNYTVYIRQQGGGMGFWASGFCRKVP